MLGISQKIRRLTWKLGRKLYCKARGEVPNNMLTNGEAYVQRQVLKACEPTGGMVVFDVGANIGDWSNSLYELSESFSSVFFKLYMFEPNPQCCKIITDRFQERECVEILPLALSDKQGISSLFINGPTAGTNSLTFDKTFSSALLECVQVNLTTASDFCRMNQIEHINLFKCDAEGHDSCVILGALQLLKSEQIDVLQFEYNYRWIFQRSYLKDIFDLLEDLPYVVAAVRPDHVEVFSCWHFELDRFFEGNYLCIHERALSWFSCNIIEFDASNTCVLINRQT